MNVVNVVNLLKQMQSEMGTWRLRDGSDLVPVMTKSNDLTCVLNQFENVTSWREGSCNNQDDEGLGKGLDWGGREFGRNVEGGAMRSGNTSDVWGKEGEWREKQLPGNDLIEGKDGERGIGGLKIEEKGEHVESGEGRWTIQSPVANV